MEEAAARPDAPFQEKQANLDAGAASRREIRRSAAAWDGLRTQIAEINGLLAGYLGRIKAVKDSIDPAQLPRLENELKILQATARRYEPDIAKTAAALATHAARERGNRQGKGERSALPS